jgi:chemotaxis protein CheD
MSIFLVPGTVCVSKELMLVTTVLGSCVSVTMFSGRLGTGAICHARLPHGRGTNPLDYVDTAIICMATILGRMGVKRDETEVKLFGGADVLDRASRVDRSVGRQNIETALGTIREIGLRLSGHAVGGSAGTKVNFQTSTGKVWWTHVGLEFVNQRNMAPRERKGA